MLPMTRQSFSFLNLGNTGDSRPEQKFYRGPQWPIFETVSELMREIFETQI